MEELAKALSDYHDPRTDLSRKHHLHDRLNGFLIDRHSWQIALAVFQQHQQEQTTTMTPLLTYFLLQVLEYAVRHRYGDQEQIRQVLLWLLVHCFETMPIYVRSKICFLVVKIARCDNQWSDELCSTCFHLIETQSHLGLSLLTITIEEFAQINEDCTIKRCQQLKIMFNQHVPHIIQILHSILKKNESDLKDPLLIKQQALICLDRLINRLSILPLSLDLINDLFNLISSNWSIDVWNCLYEIVLKQHISHQYDVVLLTTLRHLVQILHVNDCSTLSNKMTEIIRTIFHLHLKRCESIEQFPFVELLTGLYKLTVQQTSQDGLYTCLDIWSIFVDYLKMKDENRNKSHSTEKYSQILRALSQELIQRIHNGQIIATNLEESTELDDTETAIDRYVRECVDLLGKFADLPMLSSSILHSLIDLLQPEMDKYKTIQKLIQTLPNDPSRRHLLLNDDESNRACSQLLTGLHNLLQAFSRIASPCFLDDNPELQQQFQFRLTLVHQFIQWIVYLVTVRFDLIDYSSQQLYDEILRIQTKSFECVNNLIPWLGQMLLMSNVTQDNRRMIQELLTLTIDTCAPLIDIQNCERPIGMSAGVLLFTIVTTVRQHMPIYQMDSIKHLTQRLVAWNPTSKFQLYKLAIKTIASVILIEQPSFEHFFLSVFLPLHRILNDPSALFAHQQLRRSFLDYTSLLSELIESIRKENMKVRQRLFSSIQYLIGDLNRFLPQILHRDAECDTAFISLLLIVFDVLRIQMGPELVTTILQTAFSAFNIENVRSILRESKPSAHASITKFLELLSLLVSEPGNGKLTQQFLPMTIELSTTALYPAIRENFALDIRESYYKLVHNLLLNNWRYFFKGNVLTTLNAEAEATAHEQSFIQLMESIAWSFSQVDIEQFRTNLSSCNELQLKCGLYTKSIFRQHMRQALLSLLLTVLLVRSHELCRDDILSTLFHILTVSDIHQDGDFVHFLQNYMEQSNVRAILNDKHKRILLETYARNETDLPSFIQNLNDFIHDYRHYTTTTNSI